MVITAQQYVDQALPAQITLFCQCWETFWSQTTSLLPHTATPPVPQDCHSSTAFTPCTGCLSVQISTKWAGNDSTVFAPSSHRPFLGCLPGLRQPPGQDTFWTAWSTLRHRCSPGNPSSRLGLLAPLATPTSSCLVHSKPHIFARRSFRIWLASQPGQLWAAWSTPNLTSLLDSPPGLGYLLSWPGQLWAAWSTSELSAQWSFRTGLASQSGQLWTAWSTPCLRPLDLHHILLQAWAKRQVGGCQPGSQLHTAEMQGHHCG